MFKLRSELILRNSSGKTPVDPLCLPETPLLRFPSHNMVWLLKRVKYWAIASFKWLLSRVWFHRSDYKAQTCIIELRGILSLL